MAALKDASCLVGKAFTGPRQGIMVGAQSRWQASSLAQHSGAQQPQEHASLRKFGLARQGSSQSLQVGVSHVPGDRAGPSLGIALRRQEGQAAPPRLLGCCWEPPPAGAKPSSVRGIVLRQ